MPLKSKKEEGYFPKNITENQAKDTGMAMVLICLLVAYFANKEKMIAVSILFLVIDMVFPRVYSPLARIWIGISNILGTVVSKLLLSVIFFVVVMPVGILIRKVFRTDLLQLKMWKKDSSSVFKTRDHMFQREDIEKPY